MTEPAIRPIRALLIDDHALFRQSVALSLSADPNLYVEHCASIRSALTYSRSSRSISCCWTTTWAPSAHRSLPAARQIGYEGRVLVVTAWVSDTEARRLMRQGVNGIFLKQENLANWPP